MVKNILAGPIRIIRRLQFVAHELSDYMDIAVCGSENEAYATTIDQMIKNEKEWDYAELRYIPEDSGFLAYCRNIRLKGFRVKINRIDSSVIVRLSDHSDWDSYLKSLNKKVRGDVNRQLGHLKKNGSVTMDVFSDFQKISSKLTDFFCMHKGKWAARNLPSQFGDAKLRKMYMSLAEKLDGSEKVQLSMLMLDGAAIAMHYGFMHNKRYYWYTPTYDPNYLKYSPGKLLLSEMIKTSFDKNLEIFDLLRGEESYKFFWSKDKISLYSIAIIKSGLVPKIKYFMYEKLKPALGKTRFAGKLKPVIRKIKQIVSR
jgi:hypothetical protein